MRAFILVCAVIISGCTVQQYAASAVNAYCGMTPATRSVNREAVALAVAPNRISIECAGDVPQ